MILGMTHQYIPKNKSAQKLSALNTQPIDLGDLPDGGTDEDEATESGANGIPSTWDAPKDLSLKQASESEPIVADEVPPLNSDLGGHNDPHQGEFSGATVATDEEINSAPKDRDEDELNEEFESDSKAASKQERDLRKRMFQLEQKLHSVDLKERKRSHIWVSPFLGEVVEVMSEHLGITKGKVYEAAILMFYRNCFSVEKRMLADLGLMLDSATLQNKELSIEINALEDLANMAMQAEASPLNQAPPEN